MRVIQLLLPALALGAVALASGTASAADAAAGKTSFDVNCASCHGVSGKGDGPIGANLDPKPRDFSVGEFKYDANGDGKPGADADLNLIITKGAAEYGGSPLMAAWGHLPEDEIANLIAHIRSLKE